jgi:beta-lactamase regulating signal transducer with metallopeptidase domain
MIDSMISLLNDAAEVWASWMLVSVIDSVALLAAVGLIWLTIRKRVAPQVGYCLFLLVLAKLLVPIEVSVPAAIAAWRPSALVTNALETDQTSVPHSLTEVTPQHRVVAEAEVVRQPTLHKSPPQVVRVDSQPARVAKTVALPEPSEVSAASADALPRVSFSVVAMILWAVGVLVLAARLVQIQLKFRSRLGQFNSANDALRSDLGDLCRQAGIRQSVRLVESDEVTSPAVWGLIRPTIVLPPAVASMLTREQLRWVLLHELAHVKRHDLMVAAVQRCVSILYFFNPAAWVANRIIHRLREYACDDLATAWNDGSSVDSGDAFVKILRHANRSAPNLQGALGFFGLDARASCFQRVRRLLDADRPMATRIGKWSLVGLLLIAAIALPNLRAATEKEPAEDKPTEEKQPAAKAVGDETFELLVVNPDGKPVSKALIELRISPKPTAENVKVGEFVREARYGNFAKTDANGRLVFDMPKKPTRFNISIKMPDFAPYWAEWRLNDTSQKIPSTFTAELDRAWRVGLIVVDEKGKPVKGASVRPSIKYKKRPGDFDALHTGSRKKTDENGKWSFASVPVSKKEVWVEIGHEGFMPNRRQLTREEFAIKPGEQPSARVTLKRGLTVTGTVIDEEGKPIAGALVRTKFFNDIREAKTNESGVYKLLGCEPRVAKIVVSAKGKAIDMKQLQINAEMDPVDFQLKPGGTVRIQVLNEKDEPVPRARIFFQEWRGRFSYFEFDHISQYADENGMWEWNEAPLDEFKADICRPNGMQLGRQSLIAREEEYVFRPPPALVITGMAIDAETKKPVKEFDVVPGYQNRSGRKSWIRSERFTVKDGKYRLRHVHDRAAHLVRIEAPDYAPAISRSIKNDEGKITINFELKRGIDVAAQILTPQGKPAAEAQIALGIAGAQINIKNGRFNDGSTFCTRQAADKAGRFRFPPQGDPFQLVILHETGFALVKLTPDRTPPTIKLTAWAKAEGTFKVGKKAASDIRLRANSGAVHSYGPEVPNIFTGFETTTRKDGSFVFDRMFPGRASIGRQVILMVDDGATEVTSSGMFPFRFEAGETTQVALGGIGRPVVGKLQPPEGFEGRPAWHFALINASPYLAPPPKPTDPPIPNDVKDDPVKRAAWLLKWRQTPAGKGYTAWERAVVGHQKLQEESPNYTVTVARDGSFRIDDVPKGVYELSVRFSRDPVGSMENMRFSVPAADGGQSDEPKQLGVLALE